MVFLAGCSGDAGDGGPRSASDPALGELHGVVVDAAIRPLPGVTLALMPEGLNATTDEGGLFSFDGLRPGSYALTVSRAGYIGQTMTVQVEAGVSPRGIQVLLESELGNVRYADLYKLDGYYECGVYPTVTGCATVNAVTGVILCDYTGGVCANATSDSSFTIQEVEAGMDFLQSEMVWVANGPTGASMHLVVGGATPEEFPVGVVYNETHGPSPLHVTISGQTLANASFGVDRVLMFQAGASSAADAGPECFGFSPCGVGMHYSQSFSIFTTTFYGYFPPTGWTFASEGRIPPPPPESVR